MGRGHFRLSGGGRLQRPRRTRDQLGCRGAPARRGARGGDGGFLESLRRGFRALPRIGPERLSPGHRMEPRATGDGTAKRSLPCRAIGTPPPFDYAALDHYAKMFAACQRNGLEPVVTLHHFVHPAWLGTDPWLDPASDGALRTVRARGRHLCQRAARAPAPLVHHDQRAEHARAEFLLRPPVSGERPVRFCEP